MTQATVPKRGSKCDCGKPATVQRHECTFCAKCDEESQAIHVRWNLEKKLADAEREKEDAIKKAKAAA